MLSNRSVQNVPRKSVTKPKVALIAAVTSLALLTACASDPEPDKADGELSGDLVMWTSFTQGPRAEYMEAMAARFEEDNPDVNITIETFAWPEFYTKWTTGLASGQVPDISSALPTHVVEMIAAEAIAPVDDVIDNIGRDRFSAAALSEGQVDGVSYSVPIYSHAQVMWYRKDLLDAAGLDVPRTWSELRETAEELTTSDVYGLSVPLGSNDMMATRFLNYYVQSNGETLLNPDGSANLTSPAVIDGIEYWVDMYKTTSPEGSINYAVLDQATLYYQGRTAFDFNSGFQISGVEATSPELLEHIAAAPLPRMNESDPIYGGETSNTPMVIWEASDVKEEAKAFLEYLYQDDDYIEFIHSVPGGMLPALSDISQNEKYLDDPVLIQFEETVSVIEDVIPLGTSVGIENGPVLQAGILTSQGIIEGMFQDIILNNTSIPEAAATAEERLNSLFRSAGIELN